MPLIGGGGGVKARAGTKNPCGFTSMHTQRNVNVAEEQEGLEENGEGEWRGRMEGRERGRGRGRGRIGRDT